MDQQKLLSLAQKGVQQKLTQDHQHKQFLYRMFKLIESHHQKDKLILQGIMQSHFENCTILTCTCRDIMAKLDMTREWAKKKMSKQALQSKKSMNNDFSTHIPDKGSSILLFHNAITVQNQEEVEESPKESMKLKGQQTEVWKDEEDDCIIPEQKIQKQYFKYLAIESSKASQKYPLNLDLKIILSFIESKRLNNFFKAIFELIKCDNLSPGFAHQFQVFKKKIDIHQLQYQCYLKNNGTSNVKVDILKVFYYERLYLKFQLHECLTVHSTISFWKELLQKEFSSTSLHKRGMEISKRYEQIQDAARELQKIQPEDISFLYRYGKLLIYIINNEFEGMECFKKIQGIYTTRIQINNILDQKDQSIFGDNTGTALVIMTALMTNYGQIIHANDETQNILGFSRQDLLGQNINCIMPPTLGQSHDKFIKKYLDTGKQRIIDRNTQIFAVTKEGYFKNINLVVKVYPHFYNSIIFVGIFQQRDTMDAMEPPEDDLKSYEQHLIMTDKSGYITNITERLTKEIGLHPKLFEYNQDMAQRTMINIQSILLMKSEEGIEEVLEPNGSAYLTVDTRCIKEQLDMEKLTFEEVEDISAKLGVYTAFAQMKKYEYPLEQENCVFYVYRLIFCQSGINGQNFSKRSGINQRTISRMDYDQNSIDIHRDEMQGPGEIIDEEESQNTMGSMSACSVNSTENIIQNFKKSLGDRKTPKKLNILNRLIVVILLAMITLQSVDFALQLKFTDIVEHDNWILYNCQLRSYYMMYMIQYTSNYFAVAAGSLQIYYPEVQLNKYVDKFAHVGTLLQTYASDLQQVYNTITKLRSDRVYTNDKLMSEYEYQIVPMYMIDQANVVQLVFKPYRVAMEEFLIDVQALNNTTQSEVIFSSVLRNGNPYLAIGQTQPTTNSVVKQGWAAMVNSIRSIRTFSENSTAYYQQLAQSNLTLTPFLIVLIVSAIITVVSILVVLYLIWINEQVQEDILSLYSHIQVMHIVQVYSRCNLYMIELMERSQFTDDFNQSIRKNDREEFKEESKKNNSRKKHKPSNSLFGKIVRLTVKEMQNVHDQYEQCMEEETLRIQSNAGIQMHGDSQSNIKKKKQINRVEKQQSKPANMKVMKAFKVGKKMNNAIEQIIEEEEKEEISDEDSSRSQFEMKKDMGKRKKSVGKQKKSDGIDMDESKNQQKEDQRLQSKISKSIQTHNIGRKMLSILLGIAMFSYFIVVYQMQTNFNNNSQAVQAAYAPIFNRQIFEIITRVLQKDRVYYNNSLVSFDWDPVYGLNTDIKYYDKTVANEQLIAGLKQNHAPITDNIVNNLIQQDSPNFCNYFIGSPTNYSSQTQSQSNILSLNFDGFNSYQQEIKSVMAACRAAFDGDITTLQILFQSGVDLNQVDYSSRSPLHYAVRGNMTTSVQFLINSGVNLNQADRWHGKPLDYATVNSTIQNILVSNNATNGSQQTVTAALPFTLTDNQLRMYYASYHNDVLSAQILSQLNMPINAVDIDGRTVLHVTAMQGNLEMADFLINLGADGTMIDAHGNDALKDAQNGYFNDLSQYILNAIINIYLENECSIYDKGILTQGEISIVGLFDISTTKLYIDTFNTPDYATRLLLLKGYYLDNGINYTDPIAKLVTWQWTIPEIIVGFQDFYLKPIFNDLLNQITSTMNSMNISQNQYSKIAFALFIIFEVFLMIFARRILMVRLREDILESRGILNMIPNHIIYQNKTAMESIIKKLQD